MSKHIINIKPGGKMVMVHDDRLISLHRHGAAKIRRASHVEPGDPAKGQNPTDWWVDMSPSGGGTHGPFVNRKAAITFEVRTLQASMTR